MREHHLFIVAGPARRVPARVALLLMPLDVEIVEIRFSRHPDSGFWWIRLAVRVASSAQLALLTARLNRLVDVHRVVTADSSR